MNLIRRLIKEFGAKMELRDYQRQAIIDIRKAFAKEKRVFFELPTGGGKTVIFSEITRLAERRGTNVWIMVPRRELLEQASEKLADIGVAHGVIAPGFTESKLYNTHVVSKDTWIRRKETVKTNPDMIIVDEGHLAFDRYMDVIETYPNAYFLFVSATPERLDGKPLSELAPILVRGPSMRYLISNRFLSAMRIFCPPINGIDTIKKVGTEFNAINLDEFLEEKKIYGKATENYKKLAHKKPCIVFCRNIDASKKVANRFCEAGYIFEPIDGTMPKGRRKMILDGIRDGKIDGITSCELVTYGLDVPRIECISMLRPTMSRALFYQMIGRGLRPKDSPCIVLDHVGNVKRHCPDRMPWDRVDWNYDGTSKTTKKNEKQESIRWCPYKDFEVCTKKSCVGCEYNESKKPIQDIKEIDGELVQMAGNIPLKDRPQIEQVYYQDRIREASKGAIVSQDAYDITQPENIIDPQKVRQLLEVAIETGRQPLWIYWHLCDHWHIVCDPLLHEIRRQKGYKQGWITHKRLHIQSVLDERARKQNRSSR